MWAEARCEREEEVIKGREEWMKEESECREERSEGRWAVRGVAGVVAGEGQFGQIGRWSEGM